MATPTHEQILATLSDEFRLNFVKMKRKRILYECYENGKYILLCTPKSKIHVNGNGWIDLTTAQVDMFEQSDLTILAFRLSGGNVYYFSFDDIRSLFTQDAMTYNETEKNHWKLYIWPTYIQVLGGGKFEIQPNDTRLIDAALKAKRVLWAIG